MPAIKSLAGYTAKLLTATQVITSPLSAVKELLENALDARATAITIEISANTVDVLQIRDNGHGIAPDDRGICCRQNTTSKLDSIDDLRNIGGRSLGFRGQALFALAQVAGKMEITTRVEGERAAIKLDVDGNGEIAKRSVASQPVGSTIRIVDFFGRIPVRKQTAENNASRCLASIRRLLQAYILARPQVRLALRILGTKNPKLNFNYGPNGSCATVQDAAFKVVGTEPASQCSWTVLEAQSFEIHALFPTPDAIASRISSIGHFLSVDRRPVSTTRGFFKHVCKRIVEKIRASSVSLADVKNPFFVVNIVCPQGSYDPNVEPAKDDVVFNDGSAVVMAIDELLNAVYSNNQEEFDNELQTTTPKPDRDQAFVDLAAEEPASYDQFYTTEEWQRSSSGILVDTNELEILQSRATTWRPTMYGVDEDDFELFNVDEGWRPASADAELQKHDRESLNPWTIAKMNARLKSKANAVANGQATHLLSRASSISPTPICQNFALPASQMQTPISSDEVQEIPASLQSLLGKDVPCFGGQKPVTPKRKAPLAYAGLLTPKLSSSPIRQSSQRSQQVGTTKQRHGIHNHDIDKTIVQPMRRADCDRAELGSNPQGRSGPQHDTRKGINIRKALEHAKRPNHPFRAGRQISQIEYSVDSVLPINQWTENEFDVYLQRQVLEGSSQYSQGITRKPEVNDLPKPAASWMDPLNTWTPINAHPPLPQPEISTLRPDTAQRRRTKGGKSSKSSKSPLEYVPDGYQTQHIIHRVKHHSVQRERLAYFFDANVNDLSYDESAPYQYDDLQDRLPQSTLLCMGGTAVQLLKEKLRDAEISNVEAALVFTHTLARLGKASETSGIA